MKLRFIKDAFVDGKLVFSAGLVYEFDSEQSAYRWIRRGVAEIEVVESPKKEIETTRKGKKKIQVEELL